MTLEIVKYGSPILRQKGVRIEKVTSEIKDLAAQMLETMSKGRGVGLAAQQVGHALQMAVIDVTGITDRPSTMEIDGKKVDVEKHMPLVLINPELKLDGEKVTGPEGCLSFPEIFSDVTRYDIVNVHAVNERGEKINFSCTGLLARAVQHEVDHLNGILFIDRMTREVKEGVRDELDELQAKTKSALKKKEKKK